MKKGKIKVKSKKIEKLAEFDHNQWLSWVKSCKKKGFLSADYIKKIGGFLIPYKKLPECAKEKDRDFARKEIALIKNLIKNE